MNRHNQANSFWFILFGTFLAMVFTQCKPKTMEYYMLVGTYTRNDSKGIYVMNFNTETGEATEVSTEGDIRNPSYLTISGDYVYAVNETGGGTPGSLSAYHFDRKTGKLEFINNKSVNGNGPCYVETDKSGKFAAVANYSTGNLALLRIGDDGALLDDAQFIQHEGGSADTSRQKGPHVHESVFSPDQKYLLTPDLGKDQVLVYNFDKNAEEPLTLNKTLDSDPGSGPRHIIFHPTLPNLYVIHEMIPYLTVYSYDGDNYTEIQKLQTWPEGFTGTKDGAELKISADGRFLYVSHRGDQNSIDIFSINGSTGQLTLKETESAGGKGPRDIEIDPTGNYLLVANQGTNNIVTFRRDKETGMITKIGEMNVPIPVCIKFTEKE